MTNSLERNQEKLLSIDKGVKYVVQIYGNGWTITEPFSAIRIDHMSSRYPGSKNMGEMIMKHCIDEIFRENSKKDIMKITFKNISEG